MSLERLAFSSHGTDIPKSELMMLPQPIALRRALWGKPRDRWRLMLVTIGPFVLFWGAAIWAGAEGFVMLITGSAFFFWFFLGQRLTAREVGRLHAAGYLRMEPQSAPDEVVIGPEGITRQNAYWHIHLDWRLLAGCSEGREGLYIWTGPHRVVYVPDAVLPDGITRTDLRSAVEGWAHG